MRCSNEERTPCVRGPAAGIIFSVGFSADGKCENEVIMMKIDVLARNGPPLLMKKFGVDRYNDKHGSL